MFRFERLDIWQRSIDFAGMIYKISDQFPNKEVFGLTAQIRRSAVSISANIAEGSSRTSDKDFSRFVEIAYGSLCETVSHLNIAKNQGLLTEVDLQQVYAASEELAKMLTAFRNRLGKWKTVAETN